MMDKLNVLSVTERFKFARQPILLDQLKSDQFPVIVKIVSYCIEGSELTNREILRINHDGLERRVLAVDSTKRVWSFPVHTGAKFDIMGKRLECRKSIYMREIVESMGGTSKKSRKIRFSQSDETQVRIAGQEADRVPDMLGGDLKIKDVTRVRYFAANRLVDGEIDPKVIVLPANLDIQVTIAKGLIGMPSSAMTSYMDNLTSEIEPWVNFQMCRGSPDILVYDVPMKFLRYSKTLDDLAKLRISPKIVRVSTGITRERVQRQPKQTTSVWDPDCGEKTEGACQDIKGSTMASIMAASRGSSFKNTGDARNHHALQWLRRVDTTDTNTTTTSLVSADENLSEEEQQRLARHRRMLLASLDDYGYSSERDATESREGEKDRNGLEEEGKIKGDDSLCDNVSNEAESGVDTDERRDIPSASDSRQIDVPIVVEETDGSTQVVRRREKARRKETQRRFGGIFDSPPRALDTPPTRNGRPNSADGRGINGEAAPLALGHSRLVPIEFAETNYISVTKKWQTGRPTRGGGRPRTDVAADD